MGPKRGEFSGGLSGSDDDHRLWQHPGFCTERDRGAGHAEGAMETTTLWLCVAHIELGGKPGGSAACRLPSKF